MVVRDTFGVREFKRLHIYGCKTVDDIQKSGRLVRSQIKGECPKFSPVTGETVPLTERKIDYGTGIRRLNFLRISAYGKYNGKEKTPIAIRKAFDNEIKLTQELSPYEKLEAPWCDEHKRLYTERDDCPECHKKDLAKRRRSEKQEVETLDPLLVKKRMREEGYSEEFLGQYFGTEKKMTEEEETKQIEDITEALTVAYPEDKAFYDKMKRQVTQTVRSEHRRRKTPMLAPDSIKKLDYDELPVWAKEDRWWVAKSHQGPSMERLKKGYEMVDVKNSCGKCNHEFLNLLVMSQSESIWRYDKCPACGSGDLMLVPRDMRSRRPKTPMRAPEKEPEYIDYDDLPHWATKGHPRSRDKWRLEPWRFRCDACKHEFEIMCATSKRGGVIDARWETESCPKCGKGPKYIRARPMYDGYYRQKTPMLAPATHCEKCGRPTHYNVVWCSLCGGQFCRECGDAHGDCKPKTPMLAPAGKKSWQSKEKKAYDANRRKMLETVVKLQHEIKDTPEDMLITEEYLKALERTCDDLLYMKNNLSGMPTTVINDKIWDIKHIVTGARAGLDFGWMVYPEEYKRKIIEYLDELAEYLKGATTPMMAPKTVCSRCGDKLREGINVCPICGNPFCNACIFTCNGCGEEVCTNCSVGCDECHNRFCKNCDSRHPHDRPRTPMMAPRDEFIVAACQNCRATITFDTAIKRDTHVDWLTIFDNEIQCCSKPNFYWVVGTFMSEGHLTPMLAPEDSVLFEQLPDWARETILKNTTEGYRMDATYSLHSVKLHCSNKKCGNKFVARCVSMDSPKLEREMDSEFWTSRTMPGVWFYDTECPKCKGRKFDDIKVSSRTKTPMLAPRASVSEKLKQAILGAVAGERSDTYPEDYWNGKVQGLEMALDIASDDSGDVRGRILSAISDASEKTEGVTDYWYGMVKGLEEADVLIDECGPDTPMLAPEEKKKMVYCDMPGCFFGQIGECRHGGPHEETPECKLKCRAVKNIPNRKCRPVPPPFRPLTPMLAPSKEYDEYVKVRTAEVLEDEKRFDDMTKHSSDKRMSYDQLPSWAMERAEDLEDGEKLNYEIRHLRVVCKSCGHDFVTAFLWPLKRKGKEHLPLFCTFEGNQEWLLFEWRRCPECGVTGQFEYKGKPRTPMLAPETQSCYQCGFPTVAFSCTDCEEKFCSAWCHDRHICRGHPKPQTPMLAPLLDKRGKGDELNIQRRCASCGDEWTGPANWKCRDCGLIFCGYVCLSEHLKDDWSGKKCPSRTPMLAPTECQFCGEVSETVCDACGYPLCNNHMFTCEGDECSDKVFCEDCIHSCNDCGDSICEGHLNSCEKCEGDYCRKCLTRSDGELLCKKCQRRKTPMLAPMFDDLKHGKFLTSEELKEDETPGYRHLVAYCENCGATVTVNQDIMTTDYEHSWLDVFSKEVDCCAHPVYDWVVGFWMHEGALTPMLAPDEPERRDEEPKKEKEDEEPPDEVGEEATFAQLAKEEIQKQRDELRKFSKSRIGSNILRKIEDEALKLKPGTYPGSTRYEIKVTAEMVKLTGGTVDWDWTYVMTEDLGPGKVVPDLEDPTKRKLKYPGQCELCEHPIRFRWWFRQVTPPTSKMVGTGIVCAHTQMKVPQNILARAYAIVQRCARIAARKTRNSELGAEFGDWLTEVARADPNGYFTYSGRRMTQSKMFEIAKSSGDPSHMLRDIKVWVDNDKASTLQLTKDLVEVLRKLKADTRFIPDLKKRVEEKEAEKARLRAEMEKRWLEPSARTYGLDPTAYPTARELGEAIETEKRKRYRTALEKEAISQGIDPKVFPDNHDLQEAIRKERDEERERAKAFEDLTKPTPATVVEPPKVPKPSNWSDDEWNALVWFTEHEADIKARWSDDWLFRVDPAYRRSFVDSVRYYAKIGKALTGRMSSVFRDNVARYKREVGS